MAFSLSHPSLDPSAESFDPSDGYVAILRPQTHLHHTTSTYDRTPQTDVEWNGVTRITMHGEHHHWRSHVLFSRPCDHDPTVDSGQGAQVHIENGERESTMKL